MHGPEAPRLFSLRRPSPCGDPGGRHNASATPASGELKGHFRGVSRVRSVLRWTRLCPGDPGRTVPRALAGPALCLPVTLGPSFGVGHPGGAAML